MRVFVFAQLDAFVMLAGLAATAVKVILTSTPDLLSWQKDSVSHFLTAGCSSGWLLTGSSEGKGYTVCCAFLSV